MALRTNSGCTCSISVQQADCIHCNPTNAHLVIHRGSQQALPTAHGDVCVQWHVNIKCKTLTWKVFVISVYVKYLKQFCFKTYFRRHVCTCRLYQYVPLLHSGVGHLLGSPRTGHTVKWQIICCWVASCINGDYFSFVAHPSDQALKCLYQTSAGSQLHSADCRYGSSVWTSEGSLHPEGPATGQLDQHFPWFSSSIEHI